LKVKSNKSNYIDKTYRQIIKRSGVLISKRVSKLTKKQLLKGIKND